MSQRFAPTGQVWQCMACGKTSRDLYYGPGGWDESCALNAQLVSDPRAATVKAFAAMQQPLGTEFQQVLDDNYWDLVVKADAESLNNEADDAKQAD